MKTIQRPKQSIIRRSDSGSNASNTDYNLCWIAQLTKIQSKSTKPQIIILHAPNPLWIIGILYTHTNTEGTSNTTLHLQVIND